MEGIVQLSLSASVLLVTFTLSIMCNSTLVHFTHSTHFTYLPPHLQWPECSLIQNRPNTIKKSLIKTDHYSFSFFFHRYYYNVKIKKYCGVKIWYWVTSEIKKKGELLSSVQSGFADLTLLFLANAIKPCLSWLSWYHYSIDCTCYLWPQQLPFTRRWTVSQLAHCCEALFCLLAFLVLPIKGRD